MTELKTLKEIQGRDRDEFDGTGDEFPYKHVKDLRQEAIKYIKELETGELKLSYGISSTGGEDPIPFTNSNVVSWIKDFFNITDEDLK